MGWQLAVDFDPARLAYRFMAHHEQANLYAMVADEVLIDRHASYLEFDKALPWLEFSHMANKIQVQTFTASTMYGRAMDGSNYQLVNTEPLMVDTEIKSIEDLNVFRIKQPDEQILVESADMSVVDHLEAIRKLQAPKQEELRAKQLDMGEPEHEVSSTNIVAISA